MRHSPVNEAFIQKTPHFHLRKNKTKQLNSMFHSLADRKEYEYGLYVIELVGDNRRSYCCLSARCSDVLLCSQPEPAAVNIS